MKLSFATALITLAHSRSVRHEPQIEILPPVPDCYDSNMTYADTGDDGCIWYSQGTNYMTCGVYDTEDFKANEMCCACGGGSEVPVVYSMECGEQNFGATDNGGDGCDWYFRSQSNRDRCGNYDDDDFTASLMCCACGGGKDYPVMEPTVDPAPVIGGWYPEFLEH